MEETVRTRPAWTAPLAAVLFAAGTGVWALAVGRGTGQARLGEHNAATAEGGPEAPSPDELMAFMHDVRWSALTLAVCAVALASAHLPRLLPRLLIFSGVVLGAADAVLVRRADPGLPFVPVPATGEAATHLDPDGSSASLMALVIALAVGCTVAAVSARRGSAARTTVTLPLIIAFAAALSAPALRVIVDGSPLTMAFLASWSSEVVIVLQVGLAISAVALAVVANPCSPRPRLAAGAAIVLGLLAGWVGANPGIHWSIPLVPLTGALLVTVAVVAWPRRLNAGRWVIPAVVTAAVSPLLFVAATITGTPLSAVALALAGGDVGVDGIVVQPGLAFGGAAMGWLVALRAERRIGTLDWQEQPTSV